MRTFALEFWDEDEFRALTASWPGNVRKKFAAALSQLQRGDQLQPKLRRALKGFDVKLEELKHRAGPRVVYTMAFADVSGCIHVLDAFMKDSGDGNEMRKSDRVRIESRIKHLKARLARTTTRHH